MTHRTHSWLSWLVLFCVATPVQAGVLRGSVAARGTPSAGRPGETVIWVEKIGESAERRLTRKPYRWFWQARRVAPLPRLVQANRRFEPRVLGVPSGSSVVIRNHDSVWHGAFSVSPGSELELGKRAPGSVDTVRFARPGVVALRCDIHPEEASFVIVTPNHALCLADRKGEWALPDLPPGSYVVHAWHPDKGETRRRVNLAAGGTRVALRW